MMLYETVRDVAVCSAITLLFVGFCVLGHVALAGREP